MAEAMAAAGNVVLIGNFEFGARPTDVDALLVASEWFPPIPEFAVAAAGVGHANTRPDTDGVVRALPPVAEAPDGSLVPSLSFALAQLATGQSGPVTLRPGGIQVGGLLVPTGDLRLLDLNFPVAIPRSPRRTCWRAGSPPEPSTGRSCSSAPLRSAWATWWPRRSTRRANSPA
jgi:hypothetical protein